MRRRLLALALVALLETVQPALAQDAGDGNPNLVWIEGSDKEMASAVDQARTGLPDFFVRAAKPGRDESGFAVKFNLAPGGDAEFIWADQLREDDGTLTGILTDVPLTAGYKMGQRVAIPSNDIIDWTYFKGRVARGHLTTKVLLKHMPRADANGVRRYLGWPEE